MQYSVLYYQEVKRNPDFRYEAEFFLPKYLELEKKLLNIETVRLNECVDFSNGNAFDSQEFGLDGDVHIAKIGDVTQKREYQQWELMSQNHFESLKARYLIHGDILMTLTGDPPDVGKVQLIYEPPKNKLSWNQRVALLRLKKQENVTSFEYLFAALSSRYCREHAERWAKGIRQRNVGNPAILNMAIPILPRIQNHITNLIQLSFSLLKIAREFYAQSQTLLLSELGLVNWHPKHQLTFVKNYSDTERAGRVDADYFQPFYEEVYDKLQFTGSVFAKDICSTINYGTVPTSPYSEDSSGVPYIKGLNLKNLSVDTEKLDYITNTTSLPKKVFTKEGDIIVSQMGTVGNCGVVSKEQENWVFASFTIRMRIDDKSKYHPYFVALYIENIAKPFYLMRNIAQASVRQNTDLPTIKQLPIPKLPFMKQQQISQKIIEAVSLRKQSKQLLECAKRAVEIAIEQNEQAGIDWLENETKGFY